MSTQVQQQINRVWLLLLFLLPLLAVRPLLAADIHFEQIELDDPANKKALNNLVAIAQDRQGFIWFGGGEGLLRYDGVELKNYAGVGADIHNICGRFVQALLGDRRGDLWVGAEQALCRYDSQRDEFVPFVTAALGSHNSVYALLEDKLGNLYVGDNGRLVKINRERTSAQEFILPDGVSTAAIATSIRALFEDNAGRIWVGTSDAGLAQFDPHTGKFHFFPRDRTDATGTSGRRIDAIAADAEGNLWLGQHTTGIDVFNPLSGEFTHQPALESVGSNTVWTLLNDQSGHLWVATDGAGLLRYNLDNKTWASHRHQQGNSQSLASDKTVGLFADHEGNLWVTHFPSGISFHHRRSEKVSNYQQTIDPASPQLNDSGVLGFFEFPDKRLWIGTEKGLNEFDPASGRFTNLSADDLPQPMPKKPVTALARDTLGNYWIGTWSDGIYRLDSHGQLQHFTATNTPGSINSNIVWDILPGADGEVLLATQEGGLNRFDPATQTFSAQVPQKNTAGISSLDLYCVIRDRQQRLWVGGTNGLDRYDPASKTYVHFGRHDAGVRTMPSLMVRTIFEDSRGRVWIGTLDAGVFMWVSDDKPLVALGLEQGVPDLVVTGISEDKTGNIWLGTYQGLARVNPDSLAITPFNTGQGIAAFTINRGALLVAASGEMYVGGVEGMSHFDPARMELDHADFPVRLTRLKIANREMKPATTESPLAHSINLIERLELTHQHSMFAFDFAALSYHQAARNQYAYRLQGFDKDWNYIGTKNSATYTNIPAGNYRFQVKASNSSGQWSNQQLDIVVHVFPAPWKTGWAYALYVLLIVALLYLIYRRQREKVALEKEKQLNHALVRINAVKDAFLANTSHELRTPVSGIVGLASALEEELQLPPGSARKKLELIISSGRRLSHLINDILDYTKMAEANIELFKSWVEIHPLVEQVFSIVKPLASNKNLQLINSTALDERIWADANRLEQILLNLVSNSIKYSDAGSVTVICQRTPNALQLIVQDTGIGIAPEDMQKLFVPFSQLEASANRRSGGTGLGLTVTRYLIEQHGGEIHVESALGKGSRFIVSFPLSVPEPAEQQQATAALSAPPLQAPDLQQKTILFADDDTINCMILYKQLKHTGAYLLEANNGLKAWEILQEQIPVDLVILDLQMPQLDGFEVAKNMRATVRWQQTPIIFLSANITDQDSQIAQSLAPARILLKPITKHLLWQQLTELLITSR